MHVSFHIGAHVTDEDQLVKSLLKNKGRLADEGIVVPGPGRYRRVLADVQGRLRGGKASLETQDVVLETIMDVDEADRLEAVIHENQANHERSGHWGVPTCVFKNEPFFGQDRLDVLLWRLQKEGLQARGAG